MIKKLLFAVFIIILGLTPCLAGHHVSYHSGYHHVGHRNYYYNSGYVTPYVAPVVVNDYNYGWNDYNCSDFYWTDIFGVRHLRYDVEGRPWYHHHYGVHFHVR